MESFIKFIYEGYWVYGSWVRDFSYSFFAGMIILFLVAGFFIKYKVPRREIIFNQIALSTSILLGLSIIFNVSIFLNGLLAGFLLPSLILYIYYSSKNISDLYMRISLVLSVLLITSILSVAFAYVRGYRTSELENSISAASGPLSRLSHSDFPELSRKTYDDYFKVVVALENIKELKKEGFSSLKDLTYNIKALEEVEDKLPSYDSLMKLNEAKKDGKKFSY